MRGNRNDDSPACYNQTRFAYNQPHGGCVNERDEDAGTKQPVTDIYDAMKEFFEGHEPNTGRALESRLIGGYRAWLTVEDLNAWHTFCKALPEYQTALSKAVRADAVLAMVESGRATVEEYCAACEAHRNAEEQLFPIAEKWHHDRRVAMAEEWNRKRRERSQPKRKEG